MPERPAVPAVPGHRLVKAGIAAVVALAAFQEVVYARHRVARATSGWWEDVQHRRDTQIDEAALEFLIRRLARH